jgi:hypothetical protein
MTDFGGDMVCRAIWQTQELLDPLGTGDGPQGIIAIERE